MQSEPVMSAAALNRFLEAEFPQMNGQMVVEEVQRNFTRCSMAMDDRHLRPGGTVSGPTMFTLADCAFYTATLAMIGPQALAVTTSSSINFMRKPDPTMLIAEARILKLGRILCVGDVLIFNPHSDDPVAHATMTYAIPPAK